MNHNEKVKIGLCLSGGGYRAMLFHAGALLRLNEIGWLRKLDRISSVSGGSITAGVLAMKWAKLEWDDNGVAQNFEDEVVKPILQMASITIDVKAVIKGKLFFGGAAEHIRKAYEKYLFGQTSLQSIPDYPRFVFNAVNLQSGVLWRFSKPYMRDYRVGEIINPDIPLSVAVTASSAFPPFLSPYRLKLDSDKFTPNTGQDLQKEPYTKNVVLSDGGAYDNLGLETMKGLDLILVSEAGQKLDVKENIGNSWISQTLRVLLLVYNQVRSQRVRNFLDDIEKGVKKGTYWGIGTNILDYKLEEVLSYPFQETIKLAQIPTRLKQLDQSVQFALINWGYAVCDAAIRKYLDSDIAPPKNFPFSDMD